MVGVQVLALEDILKKILWQGRLAAVGAQDHQRFKFARTVGEKRFIITA